MATAALPADADVRGGGRVLACLLGALLLVGLTARLQQYLDGHSYWYDEAYLLLNIFSRPAGALLGSLADDQAAPPLYLWLLRGLYLALGPGERVMRLPAFAAGLAALALLVPLARQVAGQPGWVWAVGLGMVCDHAVMHGCEVKPYAGDLLAAEAVLLAAACLLTAASAGRRRSAAAALLSLAAVAPWLSYPSAFVLGGASAALLVEAVRRRDRRLSLLWLVVSALTLASCAALWLAVARHQHSEGLVQFWAPFSPDLSSPGAALRWSIGYLVHVGDYGATGLGVPVLLLAVVGWAVLTRRSAALAVLLAAPLALAWVAGVARAYPLRDRLVFWAAPCLWLAAAAGAGALARRLGGRWAATGQFLLAAALLLPGAVRMAADLVTGPGHAQFREAFTHVHAHWRGGDRLWVCHPQVYEVYFGRPDWLLGSYTPYPDVEQAARAGRLWAVFGQPPPGRPGPHDVLGPLQAVCTPVARHDVQGLTIVLFEPRTPAPVR
jgi:hypothetical protein